MMNRTDLLKGKLNAKENVDSLVAQLIEEDKDFMERKQTELGYNIKDLTKTMKARLSSDSPIDNSVIESVFAQLETARATLALYKKFEKEFLS